jgi:hypothetical protein
MADCLHLVLGSVRVIGWNLLGMETDLLKVGLSSVRKIKLEYYQGYLANLSYQV